MARTLIGTVASDKPDKTIIVSVHTRRTHALYKKQFTVTERFMAHDEKNEAHTGDKVSIVETRPLSSRKRYILEKIIERPAIRQDQTVDAVTKLEEPVKEKPTEVEKPKKPTAKVAKAEKVEEPKEEATK